MSKNVEFPIKKPKSLSPRIEWLRDYYFKGTARAWNNEFTAWTTGTTWDSQYDEMTYYIVPETYPFMQTFKSSIQQMAKKVQLDSRFWTWSLIERKAWFLREVLIHYQPQEILPGDLIAGAHFNLMTSNCWNEQEAKEHDRLIYGKKGARATMKWFHDHGYGNSGATSGHLIPGYDRILKIGWKGVYAELESFYSQLSLQEKNTDKGAQLRAMMTSAQIPKLLAEKYAEKCTQLATIEKDKTRKKELEQMAQNLKKVPWEAPRTCPAFS